VVISAGNDTLTADADDELAPGDTAERECPIVTENADGDPALIVTTRGEYGYVGRLVVDFDEDGVLVPMDGAAGSFTDTAVSGAFVTTDETVDELWDSQGLGDPFAEGTRGEIVADLTEAVRGVVLDKDSNVLGRTDVFLEGRREQVRAEETNLGNLTADANLFVARQVEPEIEVSIKNAGGIRAPIGEVGMDGELLPPQANPETGNEAGDVSQLDVENALRFNNGLALVTVSADELKQVVEEAVSGVAPGATPGAFPQVAGLRIGFDPDQPAGERVESLAITDDQGTVQEVLVEDGAVVADPSREIRVVTLGFLAEGGDNYPFPAFGDIDAVGLTEVLDDPGAADFAEPGTEQDALAEYLLANFAEEPFAAADTPAAGDTRVVNLNARDFPDDGGGDGDTTPIYAIQGAALASTLEGEEVTTTGVVTAVDGNGFYLQDLEGDGDDSTSDGIFVFTGGAPEVAVGDEAEVTGTWASSSPVVLPPATCRSPRLAAAPRWRWSPAGTRCRPRCRSGRAAGCRRPSRSRTGSDSTNRSRACWSPRSSRSWSARPTRSARSTPWSATATAA
jgi:hypothetical protein